MGRLRRKGLEEQKNRGLRFRRPSPGHRLSRGGHSPLRRAIHAAPEKTESRSMSVHERRRQPLQQVLERALWLTSWLVMALLMLYGLGHSMIHQVLALCRPPSSEAPRPERRLHRRRKRAGDERLHPHRQTRRQRERRTDWRSLDQGRERGLPGWREFARHDLPRPGRFSA